MPRMGKAVADVAIGDVLLALALPGPVVERSCTAPDVPPNVVSPVPDELSNDDESGGVTPLASVLPLPAAPEPGARSAPSAVALTSTWAIPKVIEVVVV